MFEYFARMLGSIILKTLRFLRSHPAAAHILVSIVYLTSHVCFPRFHVYVLSKLSTFLARNVVT